MGTRGPLCRGPSKPMTSRAASLFVAVCLAAASARPPHDFHRYEAIYGLGAPPGRDGWDVTIQDPIDARKTALSVNLRDRALSVAGSSEKFFEAAGVRYSHIMDPRTGRPVQGVLSVAVLANSGTAGDALDDAFFVLGPERSRAYLNRLPGTEAMFFLPDASRGWTMVRLRSRRHARLIEGAGRGPNCCSVG